MSGGSVTQVWRGVFAKNSVFRVTSVMRTARGKEMSFKTDTAKIKRWREERHWSQEHLADLAGVGLRTIQRIENGEQASRESLKALASAYQVEVSALYIDPDAEVASQIREKNAKGIAAVQLSFWIHLASWVIGMAVFAAISIGSGCGSGVSWRDGRDRDGDSAVPVDGTRVFILRIGVSKFQKSSFCLPFRIIYHVRYDAGACVVPG